MPYVEGFGTWPFGEEWLWEAMATSYLPLLDVLAREEAAVTLSLTPVLCDQLEAPGIAERFEAVGRDLLGALAPHAGWTSSATHAVLPLLATSAGVELQAATGIAAHRRRFE